MELARLIACLLAAHLCTVCGGDEQMLRRTRRIARRGVARHVASSSLNVKLPRKRCPRYWLPSQRGNHEEVKFSKRDSRWLAAHVSESGRETEARGMI